MLAVFDSAVAKAPEGLRRPEAKDAGGGAGKVDSLVDSLSSSLERAITISFGSSGTIVYSSAKQNPFFPRLFYTVDDIFCLFDGHISSVPHLKQLYGLSKNDTEVNIVIEAYRTLRDRGAFHPVHVLRDQLIGKFAFILFDASSECVFMATDAEGSVPFFWGTDSEDHLILCNDMDIIKNICGKSNAPFPKGCFFTTSGGLQSFEHPHLKVKAVQIFDSNGQVCGSTFVVDENSKKETAGRLPRVGSADSPSQF